MHDFHLTRSELTCLRSGGWISNSVRGLYYYELWLCFAYVNSLICTFHLWFLQFMAMVVRTIIADQQEQQGKVTRHIFCPFFMDKIVRKGSGFALGDHIQEFMPEQLKYNLGDADFIFAPVLFDDHWFCYAIETRSMRFYALDSLVDSVTFNALQMDETLKQQSMEPKHYARRKMSKGFKETFRHKNKMATHCVSLIFC